MKNKNIATVAAVMVIILAVLSSCATSSGRHQMDFAERLRGKCLDRDGNQVMIDSDYYLVYYAADWCPYCKEFQETLKQTEARLGRMYGNVQFIFAGHVRDASNADMLLFLNEGDYDFPYVPYECRSETGIMSLVDVPKFWIPGFVLLDRQGNVLESSNGQTKEDYDRDRPLRRYETLQQCDCFKPAD